VIEQTFTELVDAGVDVRRACGLVGRPRSTHYWRRRPKPAEPAQRESRPRPANALSDAERARIRHYLCSESTMYADPARNRRVARTPQATHPPKVKPELVAYQPAEVYSWDITKLRSPLRGVWYDLYVMLDIFSRYALGWTLAETETAELATEFIDDVIRTHGKPNVVHADRGVSTWVAPRTMWLCRPPRSRSLAERTSTWVRRGRTS